MSCEREKKEVIYWAARLNEKGLISAKSGNISWRISDKEILVTSHDSYLGYLDEKEICLVDLEGNIFEGMEQLTSEQELHLSIYKKFKDIKVVIHAHSPYTTAFFYYFNTLEVFSYENRFYLGDLKTINQETPTVAKVEPVLEALDKNNIVVLKYHGVVAIGKNFKEAFSLIELLEKQAEVNLLIKGLGLKSDTSLSQDIEEKEVEKESIKRYKMLSEEHARRLTELVNNDSEVQELGKKYGLTCTLAVKNQDTGEVMCFYYENGRIVRVDKNEDAEFVIIGNEDILRKVFNKEIDPFVASTQGKVKTKGNFAKMSKWYPVMVRTFKLWEQAPVF